jgi:hypothetical protein
MLSESAGLVGDHTQAKRHSKVDRVIFEGKARTHSKFAVLARISRHLAFLPFTRGNLRGLSTRAST